MSNLNKKIYAKIEEWRNRPIEGEHPYLYVDDIVMKRTWAGEVRNVSLLVASAVNSEGYREILGIREGAKEDKSGWSGFLRHLVDRGLKGVQLIISDACHGLVESLADYLPDARWQRCTVHFYRNVFSHVPSTTVREISHMLKAIHAHKSRQATQEKAATVVKDLRRQKLGKAADLVETHIDETLSHYSFPDSHWLKILGALVLVALASGGAGYSLAVNGLGQNGFGTGYLGEYSLGSALTFEVVATLLFVLWSLVLRTEGPRPPWPGWPSA